MIERGGQEVLINIQPDIVIEKDRFGSEYKIGRIGIIAEQDPSFFQKKKYILSFLYSFSLLMV